MLFKKSNDPKILKKKKILKDVFSKGKKLTLKEKENGGHGELVKHVCKSKCFYYKY